MANTQHSRFIYTDKGAIQSGINAGTINEYDIVVSKSTKELILITDDYQQLPIKSRIYRFEDVDFAIEQLNKNTDTYAGQLVAILYKGRYTAYIVNWKNDKWTVNPLNEYEGSIDYDELINAPITNLTGNLSAPINVSSLNTGIYRIDGQYKITDKDYTTYLSAVSNIFLVEHKPDGTVNIKKISANDITDYSINQAGNMTISNVATTAFLLEQGYATTAYVDNKLAALNFITKNELAEYVNDLVVNIIDEIIDEHIDMVLDDKFIAINDQQITKLF